MPLTTVSSPADVIFSALLNDQDALTEFIKTNQARLAEAHKYTRDWFEARGVFVANSNACVLLEEGVAVPAAGARL